MFIIEPGFEDVGVEHLAAGNSIERGAGFEDVREGEICGRNRSGVVVRIERNGLFVGSIFDKLCNPLPHGLPPAVHHIAGKNISSCYRGKF